jgi:hypothetical protein
VIHRYIRSVTSAAAVWATFLMGGASMVGQPATGQPAASNPASTKGGRPKVVASPTLRLPDGKPDLGGKGVWFPRHLGDMASTKWKSPNRMESSADYDVNVPFQPWAKAKFEENDINMQNDPEARCLPPGIPRMSYTPYPFEILQLPNRVVFIYEGGTHIWRNVWMDGRPHAKDPNPTWLGDSIGHWEGDTLVADAVGFNDKSWLDEAGHPHTEKLHLIERFTRTDSLSMKYEVTVDDPGAYTKSWTSSTTIPFQPGEQLMEYICQEGERDLVHLRPGR